MPSRSDVSTHAHRRAPRFAAVIPVGANALEVARGNALISSLLAWERNHLSWCVIAENAGFCSGLAELTRFPDRCRTVQLEGASVAEKVLVALSWIQSNTDADFVLKIDTDALVVDRFAVKISDYMAAAPRAGLIGAIGLSCNDTNRWLRDLTGEPDLLRINRRLPMAEPADAVHVKGQVRVPRVGTFAPEIFEAFHVVRPHIAAAVRNGYASDEYCQGGALVVTRQMIDRMAAAGYFSRPDVWTHIPISDDRVLPMYAQAVGVSLLDKSRAGEPFGVQWRGLAYPPETLVQYGYSFIHSVKNDPRYDEAVIREFFGRRMPAAESSDCGDASRLVDCTCRS